MQIIYSNLFLMFQKEEQRDIDLYYLSIYLIKKIFKNFNANYIKINVILISLIYWINRILEEVGLDDIFGSVNE